MFKYVKDIKEDGVCGWVGSGQNDKLYASQGKVKMEVELSEVNDFWYLISKCPHYTEEEKKRQKLQKEVEKTVQDLSRTFAILRGEMVTAQIFDDEKWIAEIKAKYQDLLNSKEA